MKIYLIRHGETKGNREHRYVGASDEGLLPEGMQALKEKKMPRVARVYASPLRRCRETARVLFPKQEPVLIGDLRECDFGKFEYKNYAELNGDPDYQRFIDTMGESGFPGGESMKGFQERCVRGFYEALRQERNRSGAGAEGDDIALVVHGGTIMAILDRFSKPHRDYYEWQVKNGGGYVATASWQEGGELFLTDIRELVAPAETTGVDESSCVGVFRL